ncbi:MAG: cytochrome c [Bryobacterales bacterium]|nr:cytochrome c [Bryobacterales bacterium]
MTRVILWLTTLLLALGCWAQENKKPVIKQVPPSPTDASSGQQMFKAYCASCHGLQGLGNGPAVAALKKTPSNLTLLAKNNGGKFPALKVANSIQGDNIAAHGSLDMPVWGDVFRSMSRSEAETRMRINNLTKYIEGLQVK